MGWSFSYVDTGRKAHIESLTSAKHFSPGYTPLEYRVVGNNVWQLVRIEETGRLMITLDLIAKERHGGWGYKGLSEDMGPVEVNCPLPLLNKATPVTEGYAVEWRERVRKYHQERSEYKKAKRPGTVLLYGGVEYTLVAPDSYRRGRWSAISAKDGLTYSLKATQLSRAKVKRVAPARKVELPIEFAGEEK